MNLSLNEFQALVKKAARGAGFDWGSAAEIGRALRQSRIDHLVECLDWHAESGQLHGPADLGSRWYPSGNGRLSPLTVGLCLTDCAHHLPDRIEGLRYPELLAGFLVLVNRVRDMPVQLQIDSSHVSFVPGQVAQDLPTRRELTDQQYAAMDRLAAFTYAPATEASRQAGAGAGLSDND